MNMFKRLAIALALALGLSLAGAAVTTSPAMANGPCASGYVCLYECWLSSSCGYEVQALFTNAGCNDVSPISTLSVKNRSGRKYFVYQSSNCTGAHSVIWPNSEGNMNSTWANFNSMIRTVI